MAAVTSITVDMDAHIFDGMSETAGLSESASAVRYADLVQDALESRWPEAAITVNLHRERLVSTRIDMEPDDAEQWVVETILNDVFNAGQFYVNEAGEVVN